MRLAPHRTDFARYSCAFSALVLPVLAVLYFCVVPQAHAQAAVSARPHSAAGSAGTASTSVQAGAPARPRRGMSEGIKVHGHWVIEVRRPDGRLFSHTEFENSLVGGSTGTSWLPVFFAQGLVLGEWGILLGDPSSPPCTASVAGMPFNSERTNLTSLAYGGSYCVLTQAALTDAIYALNCSPAPNSGCSSGLTVGPSYNTFLNASSATPLTLSGTVVSSGGGTISQVQTVLSTCGPNVAPAACWAETSPDSNAADNVIAITAAPLPQGPPPGSATSPCGEAGEISCAVTVPEAGDSINVSVTISFQ